MASNNRISNLINSQVPFFVRNDHRTFVDFLEAYYEYLEQSSTDLDGGHAIERRENLLNYFDIDKTLPDFEQYLYNTFLKDFPSDIVADKHVIMKHAKDIFRAKGTEKSVRFMLRAMFGADVDEIDFYYPKKDILRVSDGKWYIQQSIRIDSLKINNVANTDITGLAKFTSTGITGNTSESYAIVERVDRYYQAGVLQDELVLTSIAGSFINGEQIFALFTDTDGIVKSITANVRGGVIASVTINNPGTKYTVNDPVVIVSNTGQNAVIRIAQVSQGNIAGIGVVYGGAGYQTNNYLTLTGGGGFGANASLSVVDTSGTIHPNTYNIFISTISLEASTNIGNATYSNLMISTGNTYNMYNAVAQTQSYLTYANTGPANAVLVIAVGSGYTGVPAIDTPANTRIRNLGIIGRVDINASGSGYSNNDIIQFLNPPGSYGTGADANVVVNATGAIIGINWKQTPGMPVGGTGYNLTILPTANVVTGTGAGANLTVGTLLGYGATYSVTNSTIGAIERLVIENQGIGYTNPISIDLTGSGDGTANVTATVYTGTITAPGRYLNDDGFLSSANYLEDRDYYQIFSYVIRVKESIDNYRDVLKKITHPAGFKMFGEHLYVNDSPEVTYTGPADDSSKIVYLKKSYVKNLQSINVAYVSHNVYTGNTVYLEYISGDLPNVVNGIYYVSATGTNWFKVTQNSNVAAITITNSGALYNSNGYIVFADGSGNGANALYTVNAQGNIIGTTIVYGGTNYSIPTTATANGSNSTPATFTVTLGKLANTSGNVFVGKIVS